MFDNEKPLNEAQFRAIRAMGNSQAGGYLSDYIKQEVQRHINTVLASPATDVASVAHAQAGADFGKRIWGLLNEEIDDILSQHNIEPEEM